MTAAPFDPVRVARVLGWCSARNDNAPLQRLLDAATPAERAGFLQRLAAGDPVLSGAELSGFWAATGALDDPAGAIAAAWAPGGRMWQGAAGFRESLARDVAQRRARDRRRECDPKRSEVIREALRLLRSGATAEALLDALHTTNAGRNDPLPSETIDDLAVWAAGRFMEGNHAAAA